MRTDYEKVVRGQRKTVRSEGYPIKVASRYPLLSFIRGKIHCRMKKLPLDVFRPFLYIFFRPKRGSKFSFADNNLMY